LLELVEKLQGMYGSPAAYHHALKGTYTRDVTKVQEGSAWMPHALEKTSVEMGLKQKGTCKKITEGGNEGKEEFSGDLVIAQHSPAGSFKML
jgi:hypothetical protein